MALMATLLAGPPAIAATANGCDTKSVVAHALPAVVNISVVRVLPADKTPPGKPPDEHFEVFVGSGIIVDPTGIIVTNRHVIDNAAMIRVTFQDRTQVSARLMGVAGLVDLAVLKVPPQQQPLPTLTFANSDEIEVGQPVIAVGNPLGIGTSVSSGVVSAVNRDLMRTPFDDFIQTDASINPGNSGGPLLDCSGQVIGINTALVTNTPTLSSMGLGFSMPSNDVSYIVGMLRNPNAVPPNWFGLHLEDLTAQLSTVFHRPNVAGAIVTAVDPDSPAAAASLAPGDIITGIGGERLGDSRAILRATIFATTGEPLSFKIWRKGEEKDVTMRGLPWPHIMALREDVLASPEAIARAEAVGLGVHVVSVTASDRERYGLSSTAGVLIDKVAPGSQAETMSLRAGEVIEQVGDRPATTPEEVTAQLAGDPIGPGKLVALLVRGKSGATWVTLWRGRIDPKDLVTGPLQSELSGEVHDVSGRAR
jgi:serine protease Do